MTFSLRRITKSGSFLAVAALALTGAARVGLNHFLSSNRGKEIVSERVGAAIGMPVEVSEIDVGDDRSMFRFRVMDPADPRAEVLNVHAASADVTASDLMTGRVSPSALNLRGAALTLRVNDRGQVLTPLPPMPGPGGALPAVVIEGGRVCVRQEGRPDFAVSGVSVKLEPVGHVVAITGSVNDPKWGEWAVRGELLRETRTGWVELTSAGAPIDPELLATVPFAPPGLFDGVKSPGRANATIRLAIGPNREVQPGAEIRPALTVFGKPLGPSYRLYTNGEHASFELVR